MTNAKAKRILSGIQPTNRLHLGNYLGALKNWVTLQEQHECIFLAVDLHAITVKQDPKELKKQTHRALATYVAAGIDPKKSSLLIQSKLPEHAELGWILTCHAYMGELSRMTQFKDKSSKAGQNIGVGIFAYPALMAADILLYQANLIPVGEDQKQHIELTRDLAMRMNSLYGNEGKESGLFVIPEPYIPPVGARIMSLQDPEAKMSKSDENPNASVFLTDSDNEIVKKIKRAVTDSGSEITFEDSKPGVKNLISIQSAITGKSPQAIVADYAGKQYGHLKVDTAEIVMQALKPIREKTEELLKDPAELERLCAPGAEKAKKIARETLNRVREAVGLG